LKPPGKTITWSVSAARAGSGAASRVREVRSPMSRGDNRTDSLHFRVPTGVAGSRIAAELATRAVRQDETPEFREDAHSSQR
jgi:hypothetical protein